MEAPFSNLRLLDLFAAKRELDLASELFHRINRGNVERYLAPDGPKDATTQVPEGQHPFSRTLYNSNPSGARF